MARKYPPIEERLDAMSIPEPNTGCHLWLGATSDGYGLIRVPIDGQSRTRGAHRVAYELAKGEIAAGLVIDHKCRERSCVNPDHMEPVTNRENLQRGIDAGFGPGVAQRLRSLCPDGHPLDGGNLYVRNGRRMCKECRREAVRRMRARES